MATEEEIKQAFLECIKGNELSAFNTPYYFAKQILPEESLFFKMNVIYNLIESRVMEVVKEKYVFKE